MLFDPVVNVDPGAVEVHIMMLFDPVLRTGAALDPSTTFPVPVDKLKAPPDPTTVLVFAAPAPLPAALVPINTFEIPEFVLPVNLPIQVLFV